ncbi:MAG: DUF2889 domain-containing protein [Bacillota bacterium]
MITILEQNCMFCTVNKEGKHIASTTVFIGKNFEVQAQLLVDINSFQICRAEWEISRAYGNISLGKGNALELIGAEAYFNMKQALDKLKEPNGGTRIKSLFFECVKGLIQAETYVFAERGFSSEAAYETYWHEREKNGCRYYSHPNDWDSGWFEYVGSYKRQSNLFNKCKNYRLMKNGSDLVGQGSFSDSYHEMSAELHFNKITGIISRCELLIFRAPEGICFENRMHGAKLVGTNCYTLTRRQVTEIVGGAQGCYHLADLITDLIALVNEQRVFNSIFVKGDK